LIELTSFRGADERKKIFELKHLCEYPHEELLKRLFKNLISEDKIKKKIKEYQTFVLKDIFSEYELKKYINGIEKIMQKNDGCHKNN
jgi:hypothetical protein